ncbi:MAG: class I SAM-dependent methyltransferase [Oligoflexales bacterium]|nr:class I SAM-dependent methyltransferase [Oligoflexales bacterium]
MDKDFSYTGRDNLAIMEKAVNYNGFLLNQLCRHVKKDDRILDFGSGNGMFARSLAQKGYRIHCIEPDKEQASIVSSCGLSVSSSLSDIEDSSISFIYSLNVLEHIEDDTAILGEFYRKLSHGGKVLLYVPAFQSLYSSMDKKVGHYRRYGRRELAKKMKSVGFEIAQNSYVDSLGFFVTRLYQKFGDNAGNLNPQIILVYDRLLFPVSRFLDFLFSRFFGKNVLILGMRKT